MPNAGYRPSGPPRQINRIVTFDNHKTQGQLISVPDEGVYRLMVEFMARRSDGNYPAARPSACYNRTARIENTNGHVRVIRPEADLTSQDDLSWKVFMDPFSENVMVSVAGGVGATVEWTITSRLYVQL